MIFKIHYGLWYGGLVGIIPFMFNYAAEYTGATATQHGILYTILPFIALLAKPIFCSIADKYAAHHHCLLLFISLTVIGFGSLAIYPFFPTWTNQHKDIVWILYCIAAFLGNTSMCVVNSIGDSLAMNSCQRKDISYGQYRCWGPVGFGIFGAIWGIANEIPSMPKYTPGILTMVAILVLNSLLLAFWYDKDEFKVLSKHSNGQPLTTRTENTTTTGTAIPAPNYGSTNQLAVALSSQPDGQQDEQQQQPNDNTNSEQERGDQQGADPNTELEGTKKMGRLPLLGQLVRRDKSVILYLFIFTFCGLMTGIHWQFFFKYLEYVSKAKNQNFSLIATLALPVQALGGELVFFVLAGKILQRLGASMTLIVSLLSFAARYLCYAYLIPNVNIYWILLVELFQGPAFGLMYSVLAYQADVYSQKIDVIVSQTSASTSSKGDMSLKKSLHATLQGIFGASFEGLGLGLGAIIGGRAYDTEPILMWEIAGFGALAVSLLCLIGTLTSTVITASRRYRRTSSAAAVDLEA